MRNVCMREILCWFIPHMFAIAPAGKGQVQWSEVPGPRYLTHPLLSEGHQQGAVWEAETLL